MKNIPDEIQGDIYDGIVKVLSLPELRTAVLEDERAKSLASDFLPVATERSIKELESVLDKLPQHDLIDLAYEICIQTDRFDDASGKVLVDRAGKVSFTYLSVHLSYLSDSVYRLCETLLKRQLDPAERDSLKSQIASLPTKNNASIALPGNRLSLEFKRDGNFVELYDQIISGSDTATPRYSMLLDIQHNYSKMSKYASRTLGSSHQKSPSRGV